MGVSGLGSLDRVNSLPKLRSLFIPRIVADSFPEVCMKYKIMIKSAGGMTLIRFIVRSGLDPRSRVRSLSFHVLINQASSTLHMVL